MNRTRRRFLEDVGSGMLVAGLGVALADDLGLGAAVAADSRDELNFGKLDSLVGLMQDTPAAKLQPILIGKLQNEEVSLKQLTAAAALANAETFGGEDYVGFHTEMALLPALQMTADLPTERKPLPILKVLYRNSDRIQESGMSKTRTLKPVTPAKLADATDGHLLRTAARQRDMQRAEEIFAAQVSRNRKDAYNELVTTVQDSPDVHRFVLAHRAYGLIDVVGAQHAHTILRQSVRFCVKSEQTRAKRGWAEPPHRRQVAKLLDEYGLLKKPAGTREPGDDWIESMSRFIHRAQGPEAMDAISAALGEGISREAVGQAMSLAANQLVLTQGERKDGSPRCHGDSPGVHSSDSSNAWRNMVRVTNHRNSVVGLMLSALHVAQFNVHSEQEPLPHDKHREEIRTTDAKKLLAAADEAIRQNDQARSAAAIAIYGEQGHTARPVFDLMLKYAVSEDGRLHSEKYYRTVTEEFATTSPKFRWRQLIALARVTASAYSYNREDEQGHRAAGYVEACRMLNLDS
jgi:hypothetical protein